MPFWGRLVRRIGITVSMERKRDQDDFWIDILGRCDAHGLGRDLHSLVGSQPFALTVLIEDDSLVSPLSSTECFLRRS